MMTEEIQPEPTWSSDCDLAQASGTSVEQVQSDRRTRERIAILRPPQVLEIEREQLKLAHDRELLEAKEAGLRESVGEWDRLLEERATLKMRKQHGEYFAEAARAEKNDCERAIGLCLNKNHSLPAFNFHPGGAIDLASRVAGAERLLELVPAWRKEIGAAIALNESAIVAFAKSAGIESHLAPELRVAATASRQ